VLRDPVQRGEEIFPAGVEIMLGSETVAHGHDDGLSRARHAAANGIVRIQIAGHEATAVTPEKSRLQPRRPCRRVDA